MQIPAAEVHAGVHLRALLSAGGAAEVRQRAQDLRRQQRLQAAQRPPPPPARRRRQLARLRGRGARPRPRLRLHWRHHLPPEVGRPPPEGARCRQCRPHQVRLQRRVVAAGGPAPAASGGGRGEECRFWRRRRWREILSNGWCANFV